MAPPPLAGPPTVVSQPQAPWLPRHTQRQSKIQNRKRTTDNEKPVNGVAHSIDRLFRLRRISCRFYISAFQL
jgi:hypothetical protein